MIEPIAKGLSREQFTAYVAGEVAVKMGLWRPRGCVAHGTFRPNLAQFYVDSAHGNKPMSGAQRVKNIWQSYRNAGWAGGPHAVVTDREIILGNPLWLPGTHSPSWNATFWGIETAGDFAVEEMTPALRENVVHVFATLYAALGHEPSDDTFHLHKEDPRTTHRGCPGPKFGTKAEWIALIHDAMARIHPGGCQCGSHEPKVS